MVGVPRHHRTARSIELWEFWPSACSCIIIGLYVPGMLKYRLDFRPNARCSVCFSFSLSGLPTTRPIGGNRKRFIICLTYLIIGPEIIGLPPVLMVVLWLEWPPKQIVSRLTNPSTNRCQIVIVFKRTKEFFTRKSIDTNHSCYKLPGAVAVAVVDRNDSSNIYFHLER